MIPVYFPTTKCKWLRTRGRRGCHHHHRLCSTHRIVKVVDSSSGFMSRHRLIIDAFLVLFFIVNWLDDDEWEKCSATSRDGSEPFHVSFRFWAPRILSVSLPVSAFLFAIDQRWTTTIGDMTAQIHPCSIFRAIGIPIPTGSKGNNNNRTPDREKQWIVVVTLRLRSRTHALSCGIAVRYYFHYY